MDNSFYNIIFTSLIFLLSLATQLPYAFYVNNVEVISSINETLIELAEAGTFPLSFACTSKPLEALVILIVLRKL